MGYTKRDKELIIRHLKSQMLQIDKEMEDKIHDQAKMTRQKLLRRIKGISVTLWDVKIKDVLQLERRQKLVGKSLLRDIQDMKRESFQRTKLS